MMQTVHQNFQICRELYQSLRDPPVKHKKELIHVDR